jgi:hypothetical protein
MFRKSRSLRLLPPNFSIGILFVTFSAGFWVSGAEGQMQFEMPPVGKPVVTFAAPGTPLDPKSTNHDDPNVAVVEFNENGDLFSCTASSATAECQADYAVDMITAARLATPATDRLIVLTFIHGFVHNAAWDDENFIHLRESVDCLNWGQASYQAAYINIRKRDQTKDHYDLKCEGVPSTPHVKFIGVYIGWQGKKHFFLGSGFTLKNRFRNAIHTADQKAMETVFLKMGQAAKNTLSTGEKPAQLLIAGHSMGGLILERIAKSMTLSAPSTEAFPCGANGTASAAPVSLFLLVNAANNGATGMEMLTSDKFKAPCQTDHISLTLHEPVVVSIHSKSDGATGIFGALAGHLFTPLPPVTTPPISDTLGYSEKPPDNKALLHWTFNHSTFLLNLCYIDGSTRRTDDPHPWTGDNVCDRVAAQVVEAKGPNPKNRLADLAAFPQLVGSAAPTVLTNLYVRSDPGCGTAANSALAPSCVNGFNNEPHPVKLPPFNNTAYWAVNVSDRVISGHSAFWTDNFTSLILGLAEQFK